jgi:hypothetical protein
MGSMHEGARVRALWAGRMGSEGGALLLCSLVLILVGCAAGMHESGGPHAAAVKSLTLAQGSDEQAVTQALEAYISALNSGDWSGAMAVIADDAKLESRATGFRVLDKHAFGEVLKPVLADGVKGQVENARVVMRDATHAQITGAYLVMGRQTSWIAGHVWEFEQRGERWLLVRTKYL